MIANKKNIAKVLALPVAMYAEAGKVAATNEREARVRVIASLSLAVMAGGDRVTVGRSSIGGDGVDADTVRDAVFKSYDKDRAKRICGSIRFLLDKYASVIRSAMVAPTAGEQVDALVKALGEKGIRSQYDLDQRRGRAKAQAAAQAGKAEAGKAEAGKAEAGKAEGEAKGEAKVAAVTLPLVLAFIGTATAKQLDTIAKAVIAAKVAQSAKVVKELPTPAPRAARKARKGKAKATPAPVAQPVAQPVAA